MEPSPDVRSPIVIAVADALTAGIIEGTLSTAGYRVIRALHGAQVQALARDQQARVVVIDLETTRRGGLEVIRLLGKLPSREGMRVLALSVQARAGVGAEALSAGADDFLARPFHPGDLLRAVGRLYSVEAAA